MTRQTGDVPVMKPMQWDDFKSGIADKSSMVPSSAAEGKSTADSDRNALWENKIFKEALISALSGSAAIMATRHDCDAKKLVRCAVEIARAALVELTV